MKFAETKLEGAYIIDIEPIHDERGFFSRVFCETQFAERDLENKFPQSNLSFNHVKGTLRGMHYQASPHEEVKLVRCIRGVIYDVIIDLRKDSPTYCQWIGVELSANNRKMLYVPEDFAHGYLTLTDNAEVFYQVSEPYSKNAERGVLWDDEAFDIAWPIYPQIISERDQNHPKFVRE